jgi:hypothetical protein
VATAPEVVGDVVAGRAQAVISTVIMISATIDPIVFLFILILLIQLQNRVCHKSIYLPQNLDFQMAED